MYMCIFLLRVYVYKCIHKYIYLSTDPKSLRPTIYIYLYIYTYIYHPEDFIYE
jgi:hypothetical protein